MARETTDIDGLLRITTAPLALPAGLRDQLPPRAQERRARARAVLERFAEWGYELVVPPAYEREDSIARGLSERAKRDVVRFVEPASGHVVALRPDMTPQIARIAATRYPSRSIPLRLMYEGSVLRTPRGRSRKLRQIAQAGVELLGWSSVDADVEVIRVALAALAALGLGDVRVELSHAAIANELVALVPPSRREMLVDALSARDLATIRRIADEPRALAAIEAALRFAGPASLLESAVPSALDERPSVRAAIDELRLVARSLDEAGLSARTLVDLGEVRGLGYYTGVSFVLLDDGVGEPVGAGGRYDELLAQYGAARPATGCAIDLELVDEALAKNNAREIDPRRVLLVGPSAHRRSAAARLRERGWIVAECDSAQLDGASPEELSSFARVLLCGDGVAFDRADPQKQNWLE
ncbi:MAG: ATP phosphoribosyltransferase regulatory subunit [Myxococcales bacterium]|nr:ATP phosphoribosyltransferase regulatory subunit [Myxococcales bacterium]